jgi:hypothetical protein
VPDHCRAAASTAGPDALELLAILGTDADLDVFRRVAGEAALGPNRFTLLGTFGHPGTVEALLQAMTGDDVRAACTAARAFARITGRTVDSAIRVALPPADGHEPDDFEREFLDEAFLPDPQLARDHWAQVREPMAAAARWCRGVPLDAADEGVIAGLDRQALCEARLRGKLVETWAGTLADLERFPQPPPVQHQQGDSRGERSP